MTNEEEESDNYELKSGHLPRSFELQPSLGPKEAGLHEDDGRPQDEMAETSPRVSPMDSPHFAKEASGNYVNGNNGKKIESEHGMRGHEGDAAAEAVGSAQPQVRLTEVKERQDNGGPPSPDKDHYELKDIRDEPVPPSSLTAKKSSQNTQKNSIPAVSEWSHQRLVPHEEKEEEKDDDLGWQDMPAYADYDLFDDDGKLIARAANENDDEFAQPRRGGAGKGYTRVDVDEDAKSATSMDDKTAYLFKEQTTTVDEEDEEARDPLAQMQATKDLLDDNQRVAYIGVVRLAMAEMIKDTEGIRKTRGSRKQVELATEHIKMWSQKMMVRMYQHMELDAAEQIMIEQLAEHGLQPSDLTPSLMQNSRVKNPVAAGPEKFSSDTSLDKKDSAKKAEGVSTRADYEDDYDPPPQYQEHADSDPQSVQLPSNFSDAANIDIDLRWTVLCDLFLVLVSDAVYDSRSRVLLERVGKFLDVDWIEICRFEKRVTAALEMQEAQDKENWDEEEHVKNREKVARRKKLIMMGLATAGGGLVLGLSVGLLAPVIGAGLAAGFTTLGVSGTSSVLAGGGMAGVIGASGAVSGSIIGGKSMNRRAGAVKTFEYRPLHNNKRVNLIVTVAGWLVGKVDDVRLPFSPTDPIMGDVYSIHWEPEMLQSMGQTINILATEALTQGIQQILGSTILTSLMAALYVPVLLGKLAYLIDNPWSVSCARADRAGLVLADSLIDRNLGARPITLVGYSIGARVIFSALQEMARKGAVGLVQNVYLFGSPIVAKTDEYLRARTVVSGRFLNGYATNDWILGYLFRATAGGIMRVAGLAPVKIDGVENVDLTKIVAGHMAYRKAMPRVLREVGWIIESDEFGEIEDPDPDNHEARQRQLINEIEEARKELNDKPEKKRRFGFFNSMKKKNAEKKPWELYDEQSRAASGDPSPSPDHTRKEANESYDYDEYDEHDAKRRASDGLEKDTALNEACQDNSEGVLFDIEAIRKEAVALAAQGLEVKELESTLPPLKLDSSKLQNGSTNGLAPDERPTAFRGAKSFDATNGPASNQFLSARDSSFDQSRSFDVADRDRSKWSGFRGAPGHGDEDEIQMTFERPDGAARSQSYSGSAAPRLHEGGLEASGKHVSEGDEDDFGHEKELSMTFE